MRHRLGRVRVATALLALNASWAAGWGVAFHLATDQHHGHDTPGHGEAASLELAIHGHLHSERTPAHTHPLVASVAAPLPGRLILLAPATTRDAPEGIPTSTPPGRTLPSQAGPNHDPPPRVSVSILRI